MGRSRLRRGRAAPASPAGSAPRRRSRATWRPSRTTCRPADQTSRTTPVAGREDPAVEQLVVVERRQRRVVAVDGDEVGERARARSRRRPRPSARAPPASAPRVERARRPRRRARPARCAPVRRQALAVLEAAQLLGERDADVRVRADPERAAGREVGRAVEDAVAEVGLGDRAEPGDRAGARRAARSRPAVICVAWIRHQRGADAERGRAGTRPAARRARPRPRSTSAHLLGGVDVQRAVRDARRRAPRSGPGVVARSECGAAPSTASPGSAGARRLAQRAGSRRGRSRSAAGRRRAARPRRRRSCRAPAAASGRCRSSRRRRRCGARARPGRRRARRPGWWCR